MPKPSENPPSGRKRPGLDPRGFVMGGAIGANAGVGDWFERRIISLCADMSEQTISEVADLFEKAGRYGRLETGSLSSQARILLNRLGREFETRFAGQAKVMAEGLLKRSLRANAAGFRASLKDMAGGLTIKPNWISGALKEKLKAAVTDNVSLIKSIQQRYHEQVTGAVMRSISTGLGMKDLVPELRRIGGVSARRARFIAKDQSRKAASVITAERFRGAGIKYFMWVHSGRALKPRPDHLAFSGRIFELARPPFYHEAQEHCLPGQLINCHCRMAPALESQYLEQEAGREVEDG